VDELIVSALVGAFIVSLFSFFRAPEEEGKKRHEEEMNQIRLEPGQEGGNCPPHDWTYHPVTDKLTCTRCNYVAGS
jgi:hypothetical protein